MTHTAGWADAVFDLVVADPDDVLGLREGLEAAAPPQLYAPGAVVAYSNYGTALAGYIVELAAGRPFWEYVDQHIFQPAGMTDTTVEPTQANRPDLRARRDAEVGYTTGRTPAGHERAYFSAYPCGAALGTLADLARFAQALIPPAGEPGPLFESRATLDGLFTPTRLYPGDGAPENAHGLWAHTLGGRLYWGHGGNTPGGSAYLLVDPETRRGVVVMTNTSGETAVNQDLVAELLGGYAEVGPAAGEPTAAECEGPVIQARRASGNGAEIMSWFVPSVMSASDDGMRLVPLFMPDSALTQTAPYVFAAADGVLRCGVDGDQVRLSQAYGDMVVVGWGEAMARYLLVWLPVLWAVAGLVTLLASGLRKLIRRPPGSFLRRWRNGANAVLVAFLANLVLVFYRAQVGQDPERAHYLPQLIANATVPFLAVGYWIGLVRAFRRGGAGRWEKTLALATGLGLLIAAAGVIVFDLWH
jgi:hypothetical protein